MCLTQERTNWDLSFTKSLKFVCVIYWNSYKIRYSMRNSLTHLLKETELIPIKTFNGTIRTASLYKYLSQVLIRRVKLVLELEGWTYWVEVSLVSSWVTLRRALRCTRSSDHPSPHSLNRKNYWDLFFLTCKRKTY